MKVNTIKKIAVSTMAIAMGAALVGSISGSVAWYQYSTRSTASYSGASAHCTESLQVRLYEDAVAAVPAEAGAALANGVHGAADTKYYTREASTGAGHLDDGYFHYVLAGEGTEFVATADNTYFPLTAEGSDAVAAVGDDTWKSDLRLSDVQSYLDNYRANHDYDLRPVTSGALSANAAASSFKKEPIYQHGSIENWYNASKERDYVELPLQFRVLDVDGEAGETLLAKQVYLNDLQMNSTASGGNKDITNALRVAFDGTNDRTYSKSGETINTFGKLDLGGDEGFDINEAYDYYEHRYQAANETALDNISGMVEGDICDYGVEPNLSLKRYEGGAWVEKADGYVVYGTADTTASATQVSAANLADDTNPYNIVANGAAIGTTTTSGEMLKVTVRIYLEGWQPLQVGDTANNSAVWDAEDYVGSSFRVNMRFCCDVHTDH